MKSYDADALKQMTTASGRIGYFPQVHMRPYIDSFAIGLNQDVMDQLNLEIAKSYYPLIFIIHHYLNRSVFFWH